ncbi:AMP-binding protein [Pseudonocardia broussonetiae]|uniref:AMP-binding protein n=1 Tax=Pseudonocardia broussonetiae TaxID=2736640 RepID=A0A6M6JUR7_9PSEU|nr:AMP-binding protein [Pseudonocardia broussonetiae]
MPSIRWLVQGPPSGHLVGPVHAPATAATSNDRGSFTVDQDVVLPRCSVRREGRGEGSRCSRHRLTPLTGDTDATIGLRMLIRVRHYLVSPGRRAPPTPRAPAARPPRRGRCSPARRPYSVNQDQPAWQELDPEQRALLQSRQGVGMLCSDRLRVVDADMVDVPADARTMGEVVMRGNNVMLGYLDDPAATEKAFAGGWYHSGDLGVMHADGYVELRDRAKDVVVSGGENISTIEVEHAIASHPAVLEAAVIGVPDDRWGERPKAFVVLEEGQQVDGQELIDHVRSRIARYKAPREVEIVTSLPKTSTGKVQKFELREKEWAGRGSRVQG